MSQHRLKLFTGHYFIYTLRVIEYYLRMLAQPSAATDGTEPETGLGGLTANQLAELSVAAELEARAAGGAGSDGGQHDSYCQEWIGRLTEPLSGHRGARDGSVAPRTSTGFSSVKLGRAMSTNPSTLNNYLMAFARRYKTIYQSRLVGLPHGLDKRSQVAELHTREQMSTEPYKVADSAITPKLQSLVLYVVDDSGFFKGLPMLYYLFYRWHRIDYADIRSLGEDGVEVPDCNSLMNVLKLLEERRWGFDTPELLNYLNEYFGYYARFISNPEVVNALGYSYHTCNKYNSAEVTGRLLLELWSVHRAFHRVEKQQPGDSGRLLSANPHPGRQLWLVEKPHIPDRTRFVSKPTWAGSFESAFASVVQRRERTDRAVARFRSLAEHKDSVFKKEHLQDMRLLLETANMLPTNTDRFNSNIFNYDAVNERDFTAFSGLNFTIPYRPLIDSTPQAMLGWADFDFEADFEHKLPRLEAGPFEPLLEQFFAESRLKAISAGYAGISEQKIYLYDAQMTVPAADSPGADNADTADGSAADGSSNPGAGNSGNAAEVPAADSGAHRPHYLFKAGLTDYFTGIARKDLFSRFLVPAPGNLRQPLTYLLKHGCLGEFVHNEIARQLQQDYLSDALRQLPSAVRLAQLLPVGSSQEQKLMQLLRYEIDLLYATRVAQGAGRDQRGCPCFADNGATYTGCGCFVLTADRDSAGHDRPFLLLEKRWRVSEENDNLSYPSGGSCDFFTPDDNVPDDRPDIKDLEANPFKTAARELREELNILISTDELQLISFGIDVNRNLQQFSFLYESPHSAERILERKQFAATPREGFTFCVPFHAQALLDLLNNYQMESGAVYSIMRLMELRRERLWD